jgi:hypothetical protein
VPFDREMAEKCLDLAGSHLARVPLVVDEHEAPDPLDILLLGPYAVVARANLRANLIQQPGLCGVNPGLGWFIFRPGVVVFPNRCGCSCLENP